MGTQRRVNIYHVINKKWLGGDKYVLELREMRLRLHMWRYVYEGVYLVRRYLLVAHCMYGGIWEEEDEQR